jgi:ATP-dependent helicase/nuclease subunit A
MAGKCKGREDEVLMTGNGMKGNRWWTKEQWEAISERNRTLLVAAAAGSGKTAVLVQRIIGKITDETHPVDIDRLLVMTFTNAAATEMRSRIADAISAYLEEKPDSPNIRKQLALLGKANISTIHSFCLEVIRNNFHKIDIDPGFRIADETEVKLMKLEALDELFERQYEDENRDFLDLLESYGDNRNDRALQQMALDVYEFIQSCPWPGEWLDEMTRRLEVPPGTDFGETPWGKVILASAELEISGTKDALDHAVGIIRTTPGLEQYMDVYCEDIENVESLLRMLRGSGGDKWDRLFERLQQIDFARLPRAGKDADARRQDMVRKSRDNAKQTIRKLREITTGSSGEILEDLRAVYPQIRQLAKLVNEFHGIYTEKKKKKSIVDFNDLEHYSLEILSDISDEGTLVPSSTALEYRKKFEEILVDEYQDSNLVQEAIINMISGGEGEGPHVFMVGDVKQSIYRFRQARPELFMTKYNTYPSGKGHPFRKILLAKNFRSRREVIDSVNHLFRRIMSVAAGELDYNDDEALNAGADYPDPWDRDMDKDSDRNADMNTDRNDDYKTEILLIETGDKDKDPSSSSSEDTENDNYLPDGNSADGQEDEEEFLDNIQYEARLAARRIKELVSPGQAAKRFLVFDKGRKEYRPAEYRDIVILLRTVKNWAEVFTEELSQAGIPVFADTGTGFFKTVEVQVVMSLLSIIDNPLQDIPLLSVLRSPIFLFTEDELAEIRLADRNAPLFYALRKLAESVQGKTAQKAALFLESLEKWRQMSVYMPTDELLWKLYGDTGYYNMVGAMTGGEQRKANLRMLYERARQFEETSYKGLFNFINFVDRIRSSRGDMGSAKMLGENENVVRIMSIHKSKGLEFPVVILAGCGKRFNMQDVSRSILLHQELGFGPDIVDRGLRISWPSAAKRAIQEKLRMESLSEEMRVLYVAMTRAREKLIMTAAVRDVESSAAKWAGVAVSNGERLKEYEVLKGRSFLDWIGPVFIAGGAGKVFHEPGFDDPGSSWRVKVMEKSDVLEEPQAGGHEVGSIADWMYTLETTKGDPDLEEEVARRLSWQYAYAKISVLPAKVSVTELKRRFNVERTEEADSLPKYIPALMRKPMFLEGKKGLSAVEKGTILHFVMQHLDYHRMDIEAQVEEMTAKDLLTIQQSQSIDITKIRKFFSSPLGKRMLASAGIHREVPFNIEIPCRELFGELGGDSANADETVLLQGVIDCYFEEPDGIVLLDYKTDRVSEEGTSVIRDRYGLQMEYYARALEMLMGKKVKNKYIYLFHIDKVLEF